MAKKALISKNEARGKDNAGYRVAEVVEVGSEFDVKEPELFWVDCADTIVEDNYWYDPNTSTFKKMPSGVDAAATAGIISKDANGNPTEKYQWNWDTETWSKVPL
jgi:hypothetical protein